MAESLEAALELLCTPPPFYAQHLLKLKSAAAPCEGAATTASPQLISTTQAGTVCSDRAWAIDPDEHEPALELPLPAPSAPNHTRTGTFSVKVKTIDGECRKLRGLRRSTTVHELCDKVAAVFCIPVFSVRLLHAGQVCMPELATVLCMSGISDGSELLLLGPHEACTDAFTVTINTIAGERRELGGLHPGLTVHELCEKAAGLFCIPDFAVRLLYQGQVFMSGSALLLHTIGVEEGSEFILLKQWGWAKPDLRLLQELHMRHGGT
mmetsp:Transcript_149047/g.415399  ORF Transcript_149047/g.415399 Transcript_149047/m.415399 type:complete len:266 (-) Transcript_149047:531-1328(-)|eukprot:CAMPEP_0179085360 /NCGR_PEP_ID=MMETSP0796-20121207/38654_1 /TAXON_ID=73915 /ORGANISM="Pyrodinium bahamense, Strain pbaha01" /LENGTH=265 /DNA_ID=CAMNT_0020782797 /DNA_START=81 /DNA_END=881 /DNA_ORIENTATION=-